MAQALAAMSISGGILLAVVGLVVGVSIITVKRGAVAMDDAAKEGKSGRH